METLTRGRSLGKLALGLRTVRDDAGPISFQHAFVRALVGFVEIYAFSGAPAFFSALVSRGASASATTPPGPTSSASGSPAAAAARRRCRRSSPRWARTADIAALPTGWRSPCGSSSAAPTTLDPRPATDLGAPARGRGRAVRRSPAAAGHAPEAFLAAVVASAGRATARLGREADCAAADRRRSSAQITRTPSDLSARLSGRAGRLGISRQAAAASRHSAPAVSQAPK